MRLLSEKVETGGWGVRLVQVLEGMDGVGEGRVRGAVPGQRYVV